MTTPDNALDLSGLINIIGADSYEQDLRDLYEAGFTTGRYFDFKNAVARDLGPLVTTALTFADFTQIQLEKILQSTAPWVHPNSENDVRNGENSVMFGLVRAGLTGYYNGPAQTRPTFSERKEVRSLFFRNNRTLTI